MRKIYLVIVLCLAAAVAVNAQGIGIRAGVNLANQSEEGESADMKLGFQLGVVADLELSESLFFTPGLIFSQKGFKMDDEDGEYKFTMNYLEIPLDFAYKMDMGGDSKFYIAVGPYLAYALNAKVKWGDISVDADVFEDGGYKRLDFGINAGLGVEFSALRIGAQYGLGLANIIDDEEYKVKNNVIGISVGYFFGR